MKYENDCVNEQMIWASSMCDYVTNSDLCRRIFKKPPNEDALYKVGKLTSGWDFDIGNVYIEKIVEGKVRGSRLTYMDLEDGARDTIGFVENDIRPRELLASEDCKWLVTSVDAFVEGAVDYE